MIQWIITGNFRSIKIIVMMVNTSDYDNIQVFKESLHYIMEKLFKQNVRGSMS